MKRSVGRRGFLRGTLGSLGATIAARAGWLFPESRDVLTRARDATVSQPPVEGEIYEGFLLLPEEAPMPDFVQCAPAPILCQVDEHHDPALIGEVVSFNNLNDFKGSILFKTYIPQALPFDVQFLNASLIRFAQLGDIFMAITNFGVKDSIQPLVSVWAQLKFPRPYPVWPVRLAYSHDDGPKYPQKVTFLPSPGIMRPSVPGHMLNWIESDILYTLVVEHRPEREAAVNLAQSLVQL